ncbi:hypothetical protein C4A76_01550 [Brevibacillus laterosporus]|nr:hypothetical protein C4A76_01550 [Brevibacillus laterosporus]
MKLIKRALEAFFFCLLVLRKGCESIMAITTIYIYLILESDKTYTQVPSKILPGVKRQRTVLDLKNNPSSAFSNRRGVFSW